MQRGLNLEKDSVEEKAEERKRRERGSREMKVGSKECECYKTPKAETYQKLWREIEFAEREKKRKRRMEREESTLI